MVARGGPRVYPAGCSTDGSGDRVAGHWREGVWNELKGVADRSAAAAGIVVSGGVICTAGFSSDTANTAYLAGYWEDGAWTRLPSPDETKATVVYAMFVG